MSHNDVDGSVDDGVTHDFSGPLDFASAHLAYVAQQEEQQLEAEQQQQHQPQIVRGVDARFELRQQNFSNALAGGGSRDEHEGFSLLQGVRRWLRCKCCRADRPRLLDLMRRAHTTVRISGCGVATGDCARFCADIVCRPIVRPR